MRLEQPWSPQWLFEAGHHVVDTGGAVLGANDVATTAGAIKWQPPRSDCRESTITSTLVQTPTVRTDDLRAK